MKTQNQFKGYTLIEMIVVIAIIAVILGLSATTIRNLSKAQGVSAGVPVMKAKFEEARQKALGSNKSIRLVIYADGQKANDSKEETGRYLRYVTLAELEGNQWVEKKRGVMLPENCFFDTALSLKGMKHWVPQGSAEDGSGYIDVQLLGLNNTRTCFFYELNHLGFPVNPAVVMQGYEKNGAQDDEPERKRVKEAPRVVLSGGKLRRSANGVEFVANPSGERNIQGFLLGRHGGLVDIVDIDEID